MNKTDIIWTEKTWNPNSGCKRITEGCKHCYAFPLAEQKRGTPAFPHGFDLTFRPHKLTEPLQLKAPSLIFVNSISDLFWEAIPDDYRDRIMDVIHTPPQHQYQVLTKRPERMCNYARRRNLPPNFWAGVTIESNRHVGRADILREIDAEIRFVSAEPSGVGYATIRRHYGQYLRTAGADQIARLTGGESLSRIWTETPPVSGPTPWVHGGSRNKTSDSSRLQWGRGESNPGRRGRGVGDGIQNRWLGRLSHPVRSRLVPRFGHPVPNA